MNKYLLNLKFHIKVFPEKDIVVFWQKFWNFKIQLYYNENKIVAKLFPPQDKADEI